MVEIIRRKNAQVQAEDFSKVQKASVYAIKEVGNLISEMAGGVEQAISNDAKIEQARQAQGQKAFDASDKLVGADMAGRLKNDLLRWNLDQRQNNPNFVGTPEHEKAMRDEYSRLADRYSAGLGEAGKAEFTSKTQSAINDFVSNDVKWAYQQKLKQGEESARTLAKNMNQNAGMYGANGDVEGFKEAHEEARKQLEDYADETGMKGAQPALYEVDKNSMVDFYTNMAETDPRKAKMLLEDPEQFKETVPESMLSGVNDIVKESQLNDLNDKLEETKLGLHESKKGSPQHRELEKQKKKLEKEIKEVEESDVSEKSLGAIHKEVSDAVKPILEKSLGENALIEKREHEADKVKRMQDFLTLPTNETLHWFEEENQMSYTPNVENMSELPEDMKSQKQKNNDLINNMMKYRENFGNVSMIEISDYKGTKQMFDDFKTLAQTDSDKDGNVDNVLLKALVALNNAKGEQISQSDYNNYEQIVNKVLYDASFKKQINDFIDNTSHYLPDRFWDRSRTLGSMRTRLNEQMESRTRDVLVSTIDEWNKGQMSGEDITKMYLAGLEKAYNDTVSNFLGFDMNQVIKDYKETGFAIANIHGIDYSYKGTDSNGNPIWERFYGNEKVERNLRENPYQWRM